MSARFHVSCATLILALGRYRLKGRILDLLDERGKRLVRLEEANL